MQPFSERIKAHAGCLGGHLCVLFGLALLGNLYMQLDEGAVFVHQRGKVIASYGRGDHPVAYWYTIGITLVGLALLIRVAWVMYAGCRARRARQSRPPR